MHEKEIERENVNKGERQRGRGVREKNACVRRTRNARAVCVAVCVAECAAECTAECAAECVAVCVAECVAECVGECVAM